MSENEFWYTGNTKDYGLNDRVITPHGIGTIVIIESCDAGFNTVNHDSPNAVSWRYGVKHDVQPSGFHYSPMFYYSRELQKGG